MRPGEPKHGRRPQQPQCMGYTQDFEPRMHEVKFNKNVYSFNKTGVCIKHHV